MALLRQVRRAPDRGAILRQSCGRVTSHLRQLRAQWTVAAFGERVPVIVDLDEAPDGDIGPVVPPPSAAAPKRGAFKLPQA